VVSPHDNAMLTLSANDPLNAERYIDYRSVCVRDKTRI
jgi:hypothetical protein